MGKRSIVIGDIHGCCQTFFALLAKVRLRADDTLFLLGDFIDRGPDTKGVIDAIIRMTKGGFDLRPIRGNHEEMLLQALGTGSRAMWLDNGGAGTLSSYRVDHPRQIPAEHLSFIGNLPLYRITKTHVFVHAGLDLTLADPFSAAGAAAMLWARTTRGDLSRLGGRTLVTGHTPVDLEQIKREIGTGHIHLDNGCVFGDLAGGRGNLVALVLESGELVLQKFVG